MKAGEDLTKEEVLEFLAAEAREVAAARRRRVHRRGAQDLRRQVLEEGPAHPLRRLRPPRLTDRDFLAERGLGDHPHAKKSSHGCDGRPLDGETVFVLSSQIVTDAGLVARPRSRRSGARCGEGVLRALGDGEGHDRRHRRRGRRAPGRPCTACFPGGKDNIYEALRQRENREFFAKLNAHLAEANGYEDLLVQGCRRGDPGAAGRRAPPADARVAAGRAARGHDASTGCLASSTRRPSSSRRGSRRSSAPRRRPSSPSGWLASSSPTSSLRPATSISAIPSRRGASSSSSSSPRSPHQKAAS